MKRETALRYAREISRRLHEVNGLLATPVCKHEAVRVRRVWVFGSTAKGAENPNDRGQGRKPIKPGERMVVVPCA